MPIATDILYDPVTHRFYGDPTFLAGSSFYTMNEFYEHAIDIEDDAGNLDAEEFFALDANQLTYKTNGDLYVQQELLKHLKGASLETTGYSNKIRVLAFNSGGYTSAVSTDIGKTVTGGTTGDTGVLLDYDNTQRKWWVRVTDPTLVTGDLFDASESITIGSGTGAGTTTAASVTGEELFTNVQSIGAVASGFPYVYRGTPTATTTKVTSWWGQGNSDGNGSTAPNDYHLDVLIKAKEASTLIDGGNVIVYNRNWGDTFSHATASLANGGVVTVALATTADSAITLTEAQAEDHFDGTTASVAVAFGAYTADINDNGASENYVVQVDNDAQLSSIVYQVLQWLTYKDATQTLDGEDGEAYISANSSYAALPASPFGAFAGGTLLYAQGVYPTNPGDDDYQSRDTAGVQYSPPPNVSIGFSSGLVAGDQCSVFLATTIGSDKVVKKDQFTLTVQSSGAATIIVSAAIPKDTPASGFIRVRIVATGVEYRYPYSSWTGSTFTLDAVTTSVAHTGSDTAYVGYVDEAATGSTLSKSVQYVADRECIYRVRNSTPASSNKIKRFRNVATVTSSGGLIPASRNPETLV